MRSCGRCLVPILYDYTFHIWYDPHSRNDIGIAQCGGYRMYSQDRLDHHPDAEPEATTPLTSHKEIHEYR